MDAGEALKKIIIHMWEPTFQINILLTLVCLNSGLERTDIQSLIVRSANKCRHQVFMSRCLSVSENAVRKAQMPHGVVRRCGHDQGKR